MTKKTEAPKTAKATKAETVTDKIAEPVKKAGMAIRESAERAVKRTTSLNSKVIDHAEANTKEAFAAMRAAAQAKSASDLLKIQTKFVRDQSERSVAQVKEIGELIGKFGRDAIAQVRGK
ncbi:MAG: phasin family protein [Pseudomonadota bacterium]